MGAGVFPPPVHVHRLLWSHSISSLLRQMTQPSVACLMLLFHFIACVSPSVVSNSLRPHRLKFARLLCPWDSPGKNTGGGLPFPDPGDLPNPGIGPLYPALQADSLLLSHKGSPDLLHSLPTNLLSYKSPVAFR